MNDAKPLSLLVVDDEPDMLRGLKRILKVRGFDVETADSGEAAIEAVRQREPDGILMDIRMTGIDGVEAFRRIRRIAPNSFVIFMTAFTTLTEDAHAEGAVDVLSKPLDLEALSHLLQQAAVTRPVLVVDDEPDFLQSLGRVLRAAGFEVHVATSLDDATAIFERRPRVLVLLDMKLNGTSGLDVLKEIKRINQRAVVLQMSGHADTHPDMQAGLAMNASASLVKPLNMEQLLETLRLLMRDPAALKK